MRALLLLGLLSVSPSASARGTIFAIRAEGPAPAPASVVATRGFPRAVDGATVLGYCVDRALAERLAEVAGLDGAEWKVVPVEQTRRTRGACPDLRRSKARVPSRMQGELTRPVAEGSGVQWRVGTVPGGGKTGGCATRVLHVAHGDDHLADWRAIDQCEDRCDEGGKSDCPAVKREIVGFVEHSGRTLVHVRTAGETPAEALFAFACGEVRRVWTSPVAVEALEAELSRWTWSAEKCAFVTPAP